MSTAAFGAAPTHEQLAFARRHESPGAADLADVRVGPSISLLAYAQQITLARLALRVVRAFLDRDRDGLLVFFVGVVLLGAAAFLYLFA